MEDYFDLLGISPNSSQEEIEKAYRLLVQKYHPDKNIDKEKEFTKKFKKIQEAYDYLKNKRSNYFFKFSQKNSVDDVFDNIFSNIFGDQKRSNNSSRVRLSITLKEAYRGCQKNIEIDKHEFCFKCEGTGGTEWISCKKCEGKGYFNYNNLTCSFCNGKGNNILKKCNICKGNGFIIKEKKIVQIEVPAGISNDTQIRVAKEGSGGGDLYVLINIKNDQKWTRKNNDLLCDFEVPYYYLVFGGLFDLDLFGENVKVKIKPRTKTGSKIKVKNLGMPFLENQDLRGDLELTVQIKLPEKINQNYKELMKKLKDLEL